MIRSFSVIVPVLNKEQEIVRTLASIATSIRFFQTHHPHAEHVQPEVVIVDEGSTDRTIERVQEFIGDQPHYRLLHHTTRLGAGSARNTGAKLSQGEILFFCDGDDLFFPEHIYLCFCILDHDPAPTSRTLEITIAGNPYTINLPTSAVGMVKTGVHTKESLHPYWQEAIENSLPLNLCVRRECHEFVEGYPEASVYKQIGGCEDISYQLWLFRVFKGYKLAIETVEYIRYSGNNFDRQLKKFQTDPEQQEPTPPDEVKLHQIRERLESERFQYLLEKLSQLDAPPFDPALLNWSKLGFVYLQQQQYEQAIALLEQGIANEPDAMPLVKNQLAMAYNNQGTVLRQEGNSTQAANYFQKAIDLHPSYAPRELAGLYINAGRAWQTLAQFDRALQCFQTAIDLCPDATEIKTERDRLQYQIQVSARGYEFTQDWFSHNIPIWTEQLHHFTGKPHIRALEIGSWEGRSTCWLLDNVLTDATAQLTCIDTFEGSVEHPGFITSTDLHQIETRFDANVTRTGAAEKVKKFVGRSQDVLRLLPANMYQLIYIDGSHIASDVLEDAILSWILLAIGGVMIFDDYGFQFAPGIAELPPKAAIDAFLTLFAQKLKILHQGYQIIVEKVAA